MHSPLHLIVRSAAVAALLVSLGASAASGPDFAFDPSHKAGPQGGSWDSVKALPDWSGDWTLDNDSFARVRDASDSADRDNPNVPKLVQKMWDYRLLNKVQNKGTDGQGAKNNAATCIPDGMPGIMSTPMGHEYLFTPGRVTIIMENGEVRRIHTDGRKHADDPDLKFSGDEIGYWVHGTLIVETRYILPKAEFFVGLPGAPDTVVLERFRKIAPKKMQIETIVSNAHVFTEPFRYVRSYDRQDDLEEQLCQENNRDNNGTLDLTPP